MTEEIRKMLEESQSHLDRSEQRRCVLHHNNTDETNGDGGVTNDDGFVRQETRCEGCDG